LLMDCGSRCPFPRGRAQPGPPGVRAPDGRGFLSAPLFQPMPYERPVRGDDYRICFLLCSCLRDRGSSCVFSRDGRFGNCMLFLCAPCCGFRRLLNIVPTIFAVSTGSTAVVSATASSSASFPCVPPFPPVFWGRWCSLYSSVEQGLRRPFALVVGPPSAPCGARGSLLCPGWWYVSGVPSSCPAPSN